jgi:hypothetical protein
MDGSIVCLRPADLMKMETVWGLGTRLDNDDGLRVPSSEAVICR